jgi:hypothetical protein
MNLSKKGWVVAAAILVALVSGWVMWTWPPSRNHRLPDGSVLRVERVSFGKRDPTFVPRINVLEDIKAKVASFLPKTWAAKIPLKGFAGGGNWWRWANVHSNEDALHIWITQRDPTNGFAAVQAGAAEIVDEHGCVYPSTQEGGIQQPSLTMRTGGGPLQSVVNWFTFEAFPRHESKLRLRLYSSPWGAIDPTSKFVAEFEIMNPAPKPKSPVAWTTETLPIERKYGDVSFILKEVGYKTNWIEGQTNSPARRYSWNFSRNPVEIIPKFEVLERGGETREWQALDMELRDNSGNIAPRQWNNHTSVFLSPRESAWKLSVKFFGSEQESAASNTVWVMRDVQVPGAVAYTALTNEQYLDGVQLKPVALAGPGEAAYRYDRIEKITASNFVTGNAIRFGTTFSRGYTYGGQEEIVDTVTPCIALRLGDLADDQRLTIRAVAPGGMEYYAEPWSYGTNTPHTNGIAYLEKGTPPYQLNYFLLDLPAEVKTVDLCFCIHRARIVDYVFKPPRQ